MQGEVLSRTGGCTIRTLVSNKYDVDILDFRNTGTRDATAAFPIFILLWRDTQMMSVMRCTTLFQRRGAGKEANYLSIHDGIHQLLNFQPRDSLAVKPLFLPPCISIQQVRVCFNDQESWDRSSFHQPRLPTCQPRRKYILQIKSERKANLGNWD